MEKVWEVGDGVEDTGRRGSKGGDGPKMKMCLKYCGWGGGVYVLGVYKCHVGT